jgi:hypothetical protein
LTTYRATCYINDNMSKTYLYIPEQTEEDANPVDRLAGYEA